MPQPLSQWRGIHLSAALVPWKWWQGGIKCAGAEGSALPLCFCAQDKDCLQVLLRGEGKNWGDYFQVGCRRTGRGAKPYEARAGRFVQEAELRGDEQVSPHKDDPREHFISSYAR